MAESAKSRAQKAQKTVSVNALPRKSVDKEAKGLVMTSRNNRMQKSISQFKLSKNQFLTTKSARKGLVRVTSLNSRQSPMIGSRTSQHGEHSENGDMTDEKHSKVNLMRSLTPVLLEPKMSVLEPADKQSIIHKREKQNFLKQLFAQQQIIFDLQKEQQIQRLKHEEEFQLQIKRIEQLTLDAELTGAELAKKRQEVLDLQQQLHLCRQEIVGLKATQKQYEMMVLRPQTEQHLRESRKPILRQGVQYQDQNSKKVQFLINSEVLSAHSASVACEMESVDLEEIDRIYQEIQTLMTDQQGDESLIHAKKLQLQEMINHYEKSNI